MSSEILLGVNIDHIATLRQSRLTRYPDPVRAAAIAENSGADSITIHLREDRRHIQERDLEILSNTVQTRINFEMAVTDKMIALAIQAKPSDCCLVPESREELTTEGGLDVVSHFDKIKMACEKLANADIKVSLFIDADAKQIEMAAKANAAVIEIHTGHYANASSNEERSYLLQQIIEAVKQGKDLGLQVNAGHGLHYHNVREIAAIDSIHELNIGHAIISQAVFDGLANAVKEMKKLMLEARKLGW